MQLREMRDAPASEKDGERMLFNLFLRREKKYPYFFVSKFEIKGSK